MRDDVTPNVRDDRRRIRSFLSRQVGIVDVFLTNVIDVGITSVCNMICNGLDDTLNVIYTVDISTRDIPIIGCCKLSDNTLCNIASVVTNQPVCVTSTIFVCTGRTSKVGKLHRGIITGAISIWIVVKIFVELLSVVVDVVTSVNGRNVTHHVEHDLLRFVHCKYRLSCLRCYVQKSVRSIHIELSSIHNSAVTTILEMEDQCLQDVSDIVYTIDTTSSCDCIGFSTYECVSITLSNRRCTNIDCNCVCTNGTNCQRCIERRVSIARICVFGSVIVLCTCKYNRLKFNVDLVSRSQTVSTDGENQITSCRIVSCSGWCECYSTRSTTCCTTIDGE